MNPPEPQIELMRAAAPVLAIIAEHAALCRAYRDRAAAGTPLGTADAQALAIDAAAARVVFLRLLRILFGADGLSWILAEAALTDPGQR